MSAVAANDAPAARATWLSIPAAIKASGLSRTRIMKLAMLGRVKARAEVGSRTEILEEDLMKIVEAK
jgi:hypothetical protein